MDSQVPAHAAKTPRRPRRGSRWLGLVPLLVLVIGALAGGTAAVIRDIRIFEGRVYPGVAIAGTTVAGLTREEATAVAVSAADAVLARRISLEVGRETRTFTYGELGVRGYPDEAVAAAYAQVRTGPLWERVARRIELLGRPLDVPVRVSHDDRVVYIVLKQLAAGFSATPQDAAVTVEDGQAVLTRESREGRILDVGATAGRVIAALQSGEERVAAVVAVKAPGFTTQQARQIRASLATYTTRVAGTANRVHNVGLAATYIRGTILAPGEVFSYNKTVGPRTGTRGFREAPILIDNELVPGDGGGVCQVSSTLFNVALLSDLQIVARTNHMRPVAYLPIGRDATVTYGGLDLQFKNTTGHYLMIWASLAGRRLTFTAYGTPSPDTEVSIWVSERSVIPAPTHTVTKKDPQLDEGKTVIREALAGYRTQTYRIVRVDGEVVKRELVASSYYNPVPRTIKVGVKKPAQTSAAP